MERRLTHRHARIARAVAVGFGLIWTHWTNPVMAQVPVTQPTPAPEPAPEFTLRPVLVTAERREQDLQDVPASVSVVESQTILDAQVENVKAASRYVPNLYISQFHNPRLSFPFIRGIGSGQNSPAVQTYIDGVPQISFATSNIELVDTDRIEFLRGPQSTLYGRNALGGVISIYSQQPTNRFEGDLTLSGGNYGTQDYRGGVRGPIVPDKAYFAVAGGYVNRDGYSINRPTGDDMDGRNDTFGRVELRFTPTDAWDLRITVNGEKDRDGDFPLSDLSGLRQHEFRVAHDFVGETHRDIGQVAVTAMCHGYAADFSSVSAVQYWKSKEITDLDETQLDLLRRFNREQQVNYIEELRLVSPTGRPMVLNNDMKFSWVAGLLTFVTSDDLHIDNQVRSTALSGGLPVPLDNFESSTFNDYGIGLYGQGTLTFWDKLDITGGVRLDYEHRNAEINNFANSPFVPASRIDDSRNDTQVSPKVELDYHLSKTIMPYVTAAKGFKAGGFNAAAPTPGDVSFGPERSWAYEVGVKTSWLDDRLFVNADVFYIDWKNMQLDVPTGQPSVFFTDNVGRSHSAGTEIEGDFRLTPLWDVFAGFGYTNARFDHYTQTNGVSARGNRLPNAPETTWNVGTQYTLPLQNGFRVFARAEVIGIGPFDYDASSGAGQGAYTLTNFRVGFGRDNWKIEGYVNNAFSSHYVPIAFPFPTAPSGYVGQSGDPLTMGVTLSLAF